MKDTIKMIVFVLILGTVWTFALVMVDVKTAPIIKKHKEESVRKSILETLNISYTIENIAQVFDENVEEAAYDGRTVYKSKTGDVAFAIEGSGVQGPISGVLALEKDLVTVKGIKIVDNVETPGLGDRVFEKETLDKYKKKKFQPKLLIVGEGKAKEIYEVDGITSATLTCNAFQKILNDEREAHVKAIRGDGK